MHIELIDTLPEFENLAQEWNNLLTHGASHVPFLRHEYLSNWWHTLGGGEWRNGKLLTIVARRDNDDLFGIAPLFFTINHKNESSLMLLGSYEISDFLDFIVRPEDIEVFLSAVWNRLATIETAQWQVIDLFNILESSPTLPLLKSTVEKQGWKYQQESMQHCPFIPLPGDWEIYLAGIDKKQRHEIRRKMRRLEGAGVDWRWNIVTDSATLDDDCEAFFQLMAFDSEKQEFLTDVMRNQMRQTIKAAFNAGWLQLSFLEIEQQKAAGYLCFDYDNHIWVYNSGMNPMFREYSPGWVLLAYLLKWANENQRKSFDFMRGDEDYKYRFGGVDRLVVKVKIER